MMKLAEKLQKILSDPILWARYFCKIVNKSGRKVYFRLNPQQTELVNGLDKYNIVLKSRQLGITSVSCMLSLYYAINRKDTHCMLISYSLDSANAIFDKLKQIYNDLPQQIRPKDIANNRKELKFVNGSKITVTTMGSKEIGRGSSIYFCHISELAFCKQDAVSKQILAIEQAMLPNGHLIIESTANGMNEFSNMWDKAESGDSLYKAIFFSWIDDKLMFAQEYKEFTKKYISTHGKALTDKELEPIEQTYYDMGASLEQLMWRRLKIANSGEEKFRQEFPATPLEAFISTGANVFNAQKVQENYNKVRKIERITNISNIPSILKPYIRTYLSVWEQPQRGDKYYIGVDASEGIGQDSSVIAVYNQDAKQCAEFRSNKVQPYIVAEICNSMGLWYNNALLVVEKASGGHLILDKLKHEFKYKNLYKHKEYDQTGKMIKKIGWVTSQKTKPIMINDFVEWFEQDLMYICSQDLIKEMRTYMFDGVSANAERNSHDDCVCATAFAIQGIKSGVNYK